jgi:adenylate cyclase
MRLGRHRLIELGLTSAAALVAGAWGLLLGMNHIDGRASLLDRLEAPLLDLRFQITGPRRAPEDVVVVAIDDETVRRAGTHPLPRSTVAALVSNLADARAKAIALDILFLDRGPPAADAALGKAASEAQAVLAATAIFPLSDAISNTPLGSGAPSPLAKAERVLWPVSPIDKATMIGVVNLSTDHGGTPRYVPLLIRSGVELVPSISLLTAARAAQAEPELNENFVQIGATRTKVDLGYNLPIRFYGPRGTIRTVSAQTILERVDLNVVRDRIVLIGATAVSTGDTFATPYDPVLPGVEVLATAVAHLTSGAGLIRDINTRWLDAVAATVLPIAGVLLLSLGHIGWGLALAALMLFVWLSAVVLSFSWNYWLAMAMPVAAMFPPALMFGGARLWVDHQAKMRLQAQQEVLRRFQPRLLADKLAATPAFLERPVQQDAAVVFVDLGGFTTLSEKLGPAETHAFLEEFESFVDEEATRQGGCVLAFMGDGAMIVFGLPAPKADDASRAVEAVLRLYSVLRAWLDRRPPGGGREVGVRIGAHYGPVVISRLGPSAHQHITATGDTVNVASRLLEIAKQHNATTAISDDCLIAAGKPSTCVSFKAHRAAVRGRAKPVVVWLDECVQAT